MPPEGFAPDRMEPVPVLPAAPARPAVPWTTRDVWLGVLAAAVVIAAGWGLTFALVAVSFDPDLDLWIGLFPTLFELLFLAIVWWFSVRKYGASLSTLGFVNFRPSVLAKGLGLLFVAYLFIGLYSYLLQNYGLEMQPDVTPVLRELSSPWPLFVAVVVVAPVAEEVFFRSFVFAGLRARYDWRWAAVISSALFAAAHLQLAFFIPSFVLGFLFAYLYQRSDSVWPGLILHLLINGFALGLAYTQM